MKRGNVLRLGLHRLIERLLMEKSRLVRWQAHQFVKSKLGNIIHSLTKEGTTLLDDPVAARKLISSVVAKNPDLAAYVEQNWRYHGFGPLHFEGGAADVGLLQLAFRKPPKKKRNKKIDKQEQEKIDKANQEIKNWEYALFKALHGQIESDFFGFVGLYKRHYAGMSETRKRAKEKLTPLLQGGSKDIAAGKAAVETQVLAMKKSGKNSGLRKLVEKYPDLFLFGKKALLDPKVSLANKIKILTDIISRFSRKLDARKDPIVQLDEFAMQSLRSSLLLDDPDELDRFLYSGGKDSMLMPAKDSFWYHLRWVDEEIGRNPI